MLMASHACLSFQLCASAGAGNCIGSCAGFRLHPFFDCECSTPSRLRELLARIRSLLRRADPSETPEALVCGPYRIDLAARTICDDDGYRPGLTPKEFDLLRFLLEHVGTAVSRQEILDGVWGADVIVDDRTVDNFVSNLKRKLRWAEGIGFQIHTVRGVGYRMETRS